LAELQEIVIVSAFMYVEWIEMFSENAMAPWIQNANRSVELPAMLKEK